MSFCEWLSKQVDETINASGDLKMSKKVFLDSWFFYVKTPQANLDQLPEEEREAYRYEYLRVRERNQPYAKASDPSPFIKTVLFPEKYIEEKDEIIESVYATLYYVGDLEEKGEEPSIERPEDYTSTWKPLPYGDPYRGYYLLLTSPYGGESFEDKSIPAPSVTNCFPDKPKSCCVSCSGVILAMATTLNGKPPQVDEEGYYPGIIVKVNDKGECPEGFEKCGNSPEEAFLSLIENNYSKAKIPNLATSSGSFCEWISDYFDEFGDDTSYGLSKEEYLNSWFMYSPLPKEVLDRITDEEEKRFSEYDFHRLKTPVQSYSKENSWVDADDEKPYIKFTGGKNLGGGKYDIEDRTAIVYLGDPSKRGTEPPGEYFTTSGILEPVAGYPDYYAVVQASVWILNTPDGLIGGAVEPYTLISCVVPKTKSCCVSCSGIIILMANVILGKDIKPDSDGYYPGAIIKTDKNGECPEGFEKCDGGAEEILARTI